MSSNFNSFSPNAGLSGDVINLVEGDKQGALRIDLKETNCLVTPSEWETIDLELVSGVVMYFREAYATELIATIDCIVVRATSEVWLEWPEGVLDDLDGDYEGEIQVNYTDGAEVTVFEVINFNIRKSFG